MTGEMHTVLLVSVLTYIVNVSVLTDIVNIVHR